jgi:hypothetical protein
MSPLGRLDGRPGALEPLNERPVCGRDQHSSTPAVGEASVYVQGASLKTGAAPLVEASKLPDHQDGWGTAWESFRGFWWFCERRRALPPRERFRPSSASGSPLDQSCRSRRDRRGQRPRDRGTPGSIGSH